MEILEGRTRINQNGRVVIPAAFRRALGIKPGDTVLLRMENDELKMSSFRQRLAKAQEFVCKHIPPSVSLADELIAERRQAAKLE
jgi:AbrB family looped-hinge helix DNA binding protein